MKFKDKYEEVEIFTLNELFEKKGGINKIEARDMLKTLFDKCFGKRIRVYYDNEQYTIYVRRIDTVISLNGIRNGFYWLFYFADEPNDMNCFKLAPGPDDKIAILKERNPIVNLQMDPYGEEDWNDD